MIPMTRRSAHMIRHPLPSRLPYPLLLFSISPDSNRRPRVRFPVATHRIRGLPFFMGRLCPVAMLAGAFRANQLT